MAEGTGELSHHGSVKPNKEKDGGAPKQRHIPPAHIGATQNNSQETGAVHVKQAESARVEEITNALKDQIASNGREAGGGIQVDYIKLGEELAKDDAQRRLGGKAGKQVEEMVAQARNTQVEQQQMEEILDGVKAPTPEEDAVALRGDGKPADATVDGGGKLKFFHKFVKSRGGKAIITAMAGLGLMHAVSKPIEANVFDDVRTFISDTLDTRRRNVDFSEDQVNMVREYNKEIQRRSNDRGRHVSNWNTEKMKRMAQEPQRGELISLEAWKQEQLERVNWTFDDRERYWRLQRDLGNRKADLWNEEEGRNLRRDSAKAALRFVISETKSDFEKDYEEAKQAEERMKRIMRGKIERDFEYIKADKFIPPNERVGRLADIRRRFGLREEELKQELPRIKLLPTQERRMQQRAAEGEEVTSANIDFVAKVQNIRDNRTHTTNERLIDLQDRCGNVEASVLEKKQNFYNYIKERVKSVMPQQQVQ